jgi:hypothetical protein
MFIECASAVREPAERNRPYKKGMADTLLKKAQDVHKQVDAASKSQALATSVRTMHTQVLTRFGVIYKN